MEAGFLKLRLWFALTWRALLIDLNNFYLMQHRDVGAFLISGKNSGTHWLRHMLSYALAHRHGLPLPVHSSGRDSEDFVGRPRRTRKHAQIPFIGSSHTLPSIAFSWPWLRRLLRLPPIVVLVRDPKEAMASHFVKWREPLKLSLTGYVHRAWPHHGQLADAWWYIEFFNRWGRMAARAPELVMVVRYEDVIASPAYWLARISAHLGLGLRATDIDAAIAGSTRAAIRERLDPAYGEAIVPDAATRAAMRFPPSEDAVLTRQLAHFLRHDFDYGHARRSNLTARAATQPAPTWVRAAFIGAVVYALFNQFGRPLLHLPLAEPWHLVELTGAFSALALLGPLSFPKLKLTLPAILSVGGGAIELAQRTRIAPGAGSLMDLTAEICGVTAATGCLLLLASASLARRPRTVSARSSAALAAAERPERHPR